MLAELLLSQPSMPVSTDATGVLWILGLLCGGSGLTALIGWLASRGKNSAEEAEIWTKASVTRLKSMHEEMGTLEARIRLQNEELESKRLALLASERELDEERRARLVTVRKLEVAIALLEKHGIDYNGILSSN